MIGRRQFFLLKLLLLFVFVAVVAAAVVLLLLLMLHLFVCCKNEFLSREFLNAFSPTFTLTQAFLVSHQKALK